MLMLLEHPGNPDSAFCLIRSRNFFLNWSVGSSFGGSATILPITASKTAVAGGAISGSPDRKVYRHIGIETS